MFITSQAFEFPVPRGLAQPGQRFWRSVAFSLHAPWFIVTVIERDENDEAAFIQDLLMASGADLDELLESDAGDSVVGVQYVEPPSYSASGSWRMRGVRKVRRAPNSSTGGTSLVFEDELGRFASPLEDAKVDQPTELVCEFPSLP